MIPHEKVAICGGIVTIVYLTLIAIVMRKVYQSRGEKDKKKGEGVD